MTRRPFGADVSKALVKKQKETEAWEAQPTARILSGVLKQTRTHRKVARGRQGILSVNLVPVRESAAHFTPHASDDPERRSPRGLPGPGSQPVLGYRRLPRRGEHEKPATDGVQSCQGLGSTKHRRVQAASRELIEPFAQALGDGLIPVGYNRGR